MDMQVDDVQNISHVKSLIHSFLTNTNSNLSNAIRQTFYNINQEFLTLAERHTLNDGSTALCIIIRNHIITIANVGDCRAILISENCSKVMQLSIDQKPSLPKEKARIG